MAAKLKFAAACLGLVAFASGAFLGTSPKKLGIEDPAFTTWTTKDLEQLGSSNLDSLEGAWLDSKVQLSELKFESKGMEPKELEDMESAVEMLVTNSDDPATKLAVKHMTDFIEKTLIPNRERSQALDQKNLDLKLEALHACHLDEVQKNDMNVYGSIDTAKDHKSDYQDSLAKHGECLGVLESKELLKDAYCATVEEGEKICKCDKRLVNLGVQRPASCPELSEQKEIAPEHKECCDAYVAHEKHNHDCQNHMMDKEFARKQHKIIMSKVCDQYDTCYDEKYKSYTATEKFVKTAEMLRSWKTVSRIQCLIAAFKNGKVSPEAAQACKDRQTISEGIKYPETVPPKEDCNPNVDAVASPAL